MKVFPAKCAVLPVLFLLFSCGGSRLDVDVSGIQVEDVRVLRLEKDLFSMNPDSVDARTEGMLEKYGDFYLSFVTQVINDGGVKDSSYNYNLRRFISDKDMKAVYAECEKKFPELDGFALGLKDAFRHYRYYFPDGKLPHVVTYMSGFNYAVTFSGDAVGIGLEMYLGSDNKFYKMLQFPNYKTMTMKPDYMVSDFVKGWASAVFPQSQKKEDFLHQIIKEGKVLYFQDVMLPEVHDTIKIGYTAAQLDWCKANEYNMWAYFLENKMLYTTDESSIQKFNGEGPFTAAFNKLAPSRVGHWIGWQIVRAYMERKPETSLKQLMEEKDVQRILTESKYKPAK